MRRLPLNELQKAAFNRVTAAKALVGSPTVEIYDRVPQRPEDVKFPYIKIDSVQLQPESNKSGGCGEYLVRFMIWSKQPGKKEANDIMDWLLGVFQSPDGLELENGFSCNASRIEFATITDAHFEEGELRLGDFQYVWIVMDEEEH